MPARPGYWTRKLELDLVEFVHQKDYLWKPLSNTNHHIQLKYKAYAEFAAKLGRGFTARSVRDRWVNIRSTFSHNLRKVDKSKATAKTLSDIYVPCWPLWKPLQFLREGSRKDENNSQPQTLDQEVNSLSIKEELQSEIEDIQLNIRQRVRRTDRPRRRTKVIYQPVQRTKCKKIIDNLVIAMKPLINEHTQNQSEHSQDRYRFFGKHVTERLDNMRVVDAEAACNDIMKLLEQWQPNVDST